MWWGRGGGRHSETGNGVSATNITHASYCSHVGAGFYELQSGADVAIVDGSHHSSEALRFREEGEGEEI